MRGMSFRPVFEVGGIALPARIQNLLDSTRLRLCDNHPLILPKLQLGVRAFRPYSATVLTVSRQIAQGFNAEVNR